MKGNVFQCHGEHKDKQQFLKTVGVLDEHINKTFEYPQDITSVSKSFKLTVLTQPANLTKEEYEGNMGKKLIWETLMKNYLKRLDRMEGNLRAIYAIVWGQSSPMMQSKLKSLKDYTSKCTVYDCIWLLREIQGTTHRFEGTRYVFLSLDDAWSRYYNQRQGPQQSIHDYLKDFQALIQVLEHYGAALGGDGPYLSAIMTQVEANAIAAGTTLTPEVKPPSALPRPSKSRSRSLF